MHRQRTWAQRVDDHCRSFWFQEQLLLRVLLGQPPHLLLPVWNQRRSQLPSGCLFQHSIRPQMHSIRRLVLHEVLLQDLWRMDPGRPHNRLSHASSPSSSSVAPSSHNTTSSTASLFTSSSRGSRHSTVDAARRQVRTRQNRKSVDGLVPVRNEGAGECCVCSRGMHGSWGLDLPRRRRLSSRQLAVYGQSCFVGRNALRRSVVRDKQSVLAQRPWLLHELCSRRMRKPSWIHCIQQHGRSRVHRVPGHPSLSVEKSNYFVLFV